MNELRAKLDEIAEQIRKGVTPARYTVRQMLDWMGVSRRGTNVNYEIRRALDQAGLETQPDFEWAYLDGPIKFVPIGSEKDKLSISAGYRIDGLESANRKPVSVKPDRPLTEAITIMLKHDFSQLPVMTTDRDIKGIISWRSIGSRLALGKKIQLVRECMDPAQVISAESSLFDAIEIITKHEYVLVEARDRTICGIVTATDLSQQFRDLAEPFLLIGECERLLRRMIHGKFAVEELAEARDPKDPDRTVEGVADLTFGEYVRLLEEPKRWSKLNLSIDRRMFIGWLKKVREIRNDVMHFGSDGVGPREHKTTG